MWEESVTNQLQCGIVSVIPVCVMLAASGLQDRQEP